ncbi:MAG: AAA family ATPase [Promethearchaeota archaeon]
MNKSIAFTGKGGVGKTTCLILFLKFLIESKKEYRILVIDADPDANIADVIGKEIHFKDTIAGKMTNLRKKIKMNIIFPYNDKKQAIEAEIFNCFIHLKSFDVIEMGRTEGEGCYCNVNNVLKNALDIISENYDLVLVDTPAGLEHFARKTGKDISDLMIIVDPSKMAFHTLKRILEVSKEVSLKFKNYWVLGNRFSTVNKEILIKKLNFSDEREIKLLGFIPEDEEIMKYNLLGKNLLKLSSENIAYKQVKEIFAKHF